MLIKSDGAPKADWWIRCILEARESFSDRVRTSQCCTVYSGIFELASGNENYGKSLQVMIEYGFREGTRTYL
jgi:hypothetical protein